MDMTTSELISLTALLKQRGMDPDRIAIKVSPEEWEAVAAFMVSTRRISNDDSPVPTDKFAINGYELWKAKC